MKQRKRNKLKERGEIKMINCVDMEKVEKKKCLEDKVVEQNKSDENKNKSLACRWSGWEMEN